MPLAELELQLERIKRSPSERGSLVLIVRRPAVDAREVIEEAELDDRSGLVGDSWLARAEVSTPDGSIGRETQITMANVRSIEAVAGDSTRVPLAGDQLFVDFDLSEQNVPPGTLLEVGSALLEVSSVPHRGCGKFSSRFGVDALKFVNSASGRALNLRGINTRVVRGGVVRGGDAVVKLKPA